MIKVDKFDKLFLSHMQRDAYTFHVGDNKCRDIKVGDDIEIDGMVGKVESLEWSAKMFNGIDGKPLKGDNVTILISQSKEQNLEDKEKALHIGGVSKRFIAITYMIYIILWEALIIGGFGYVVFGLNRSGWWMLLAVMLSDSAYKPKSWRELF